jgi:putative oxidoreductase
MPEKKDRLPVALLLLRLGVFLVLILWTLGKFINPTQQASVYQAYYGVSLSHATLYLVGALELVLVLAFLLGVQKRLSRALVMLLVGASVLAPGRLYFTPFMDHVLLFFATWTMLAGAFALYALRDYDVLWTVGSPSPAPAEALQRLRLPVALLLLRLSVFFALLMWCLDKFINPIQTTRILSGFYSIRGVSFLAANSMGILQAVLITAFVLGIFKRLSYGLVFLSHIPATLAPWGQYLHPYSGHVLLFLAAFPMLAACFAVYYLRDEDVLTVGGRRRQQTARLRHETAGAGA